MTRLVCSRIRRNVEKHCVAAARQLRQDGHLLLDAFTPFPVARNSTTFLR